MYWLARNKPYGIVLLTSLLLGLSYPPFPLYFLVFIAFVPLFVLFETESIPGRVPEDIVFRPIKHVSIVISRILSLQFIWRPSVRGSKVFQYHRHTISGNAQLFRYTYAIFFLWNLVGSYWLLVAAVRTPRLDDTLILATAGILALLVNPALMSIPCQLYARTRHVLPPVFAAASFVMFWIAFEYLQFNWELSWSWLSLGHALAEMPAWIQYAEITGVTGISFHILVANLFFYSLYRFIDHQRKISLSRLLIAGIWFILPLLLSFLLTNNSREVFQEKGRLTVRVVPPNIDPNLKQNMLTAERQMEHIIALIQSKPLDSVDLVMLPEHAIPRPLHRTQWQADRLLDSLWELIATQQVDLVTGLESYQGFPSRDSAPSGAVPSFLQNGGLRESAWVATWNSAALLQPGRSISFYDKGRLAPLVERIPYLEFFGIFNRIFPGWWSGVGNYARQDSLSLLHSSDGIPLSILLSYESAFGDYARRSTQAGGRAILMLTNNRWWSGTAQFEQHTWLATLRAIENRRAIIRCGNMGGSVAVDVRGNLSQLPDEVSDQRLQLYTGTTFYVQYGDLLGRIAGYLSLLILIIALILYFRPIKKR